MNLIKTDEFGRIVGTVSSSLDNHQDYPEHILVDEIPPSATHYLNGEFLTQPPKPDEAHEWDEVSFSWVYSESALNRVKEQAKHKITMLRERVKNSGFFAFDKVFDSDPIAIQNIMVAVSAASSALASGTTFSLDWTTLDNSVITLSAEQIVQLPTIVAVSGNNLHVKSRQYKQLIDAAQNIDEINYIMSTATFQ